MQVHLIELPKAVPLSDRRVISDPVRRFAIHVFVFLSRKVRP